MDWFQIALWTFAVVGVVTTIILIIVCIAVAVDSKEAHIPPYNMINYAEEHEKEKSFAYLDNEVRGELRTKYGHERGYFDKDLEPTLKGRVDMIEKHLGIKVEAKPAEEAKLVIKKGKK